MRKCAKCNRQGVRLYRPYSEFLRDSRIVCAEHVDPQEATWFVPLIEDTDGSVWGYTSSPPDAIARWYALPDNGVPPAGINL